MAKRFRFRPPPPPDKDEQMARAIRLMTEERAVAANGKIELLLQTTPLERFPELVEHPLLQTYGAFERLGRIFAQMVHSDPARAHAIAELEISVAENLSTVVYPPATLGQAHGYAWKDLGTVLRIQGRNQESLEALATAERALQIPSLRHDLAIIRFSVAVTLQELERYAESRAMLAECTEVFLFFGDEKHAVLCGFAEAVLFQRLKRFREAREIYLLMLASGRAHDTETLAALHRTIGLCSIELGDFRDAESNLRRASNLSEQLGQRLESVKAQAAIGRLLVRRGDAGKAIEHLPSDPARVPPARADRGGRALRPGDRRGHAGPRASLCRTDTRAEDRRRIHEGKAESASDLRPRISVRVDCSNASDHHAGVAGQGVHRHAPDVSGA